MNMGMVELFGFLSCMFLMFIGIVALIVSYKSPLVKLAFFPWFLSISECLKGFAAVNAKGAGHMVVDYFSLGYLSIVLGILPWYFPFAILGTEKNPWRRKKMKMLLLIGVCLSIYFVWSLVIFDVGAVIKAHHLQYFLDVTGESRYVLRYFYVLPLLAPILGKHWKEGILLSSALILAYVFSFFYFRDPLPQIPSVFAMLSGLATVNILIRKNRERSA